MHVQISRTFLPLTALIGLGLSGQVATAASLSTSVVIPAVAGSGYASPVPATGLAQFDPANGTLTGIELGLQVSTFDITLSLADWDDPGTGARFESAYLQSQISIDVALPGGGGLLFSSTVFGDTIYDEFGTISTIGHPGSPEFEDATSRLVAEDLFSSFIGTGNVSTVNLGIFSFGFPGMVDLDDGTSTDGSPHLDSFSVGPSTMTINYTYTPAVVPLPAPVWLLGSALLGLLGVRRRPA